MTSPKPPLQAIPADIVSAADYERHAQGHVDPATWAYLAGGAGDEVTLAANTAAFAAQKLNPQHLVSMVGANTRITLLGQTLAHPFLLAPIGWQKLFHPAGEMATAQAAAVMETIFSVSTYATTRLDDFAASGAPLWFQVYMQLDRAATAGLVRRAEEAGCKALMVTIDAPLSGVRNREQRAGFVLPPGIKAENLPPAAALTQSSAPGSSRVFEAMRHAPAWQDIEWLAGQTRLPVFVKGILCAEDARRALSCGAAGLVVSNHGGRVLDTVPAALDALPAVAAEVGGAVPVLFDSGIRRGADAFKAIALGARAVMIGRPYIHALTVAGALGVAHLLRTLREELEITMALTGCPTLHDAGPRFLWPPRPNSQP